MVFKLFRLDDILINIHDVTEIADEGAQNCKPFFGKFGVMFHAGNFALGLAFVIPQWLKLQKIYLRGCMTFGLLLLTIWSALEICASQWFVYNLIGLMINLVYFLRLGVKHFPVMVPKHLEGVYAKMFKPLNMGKKASPVHSSLVRLFHCTISRICGNLTFH